MDDTVKAALDGHAKLALWEEDFGKLGSKQVHDEFTSNAAIGASHANGTKFGVVRGVLVEGHEVIGREGLFQLWWDVSIEDEFKGAGE